ncbi:hypothetical protein AXFE_17310 [Acidithrix ferrooxidans]|uniref:Uncharacterized protein n=1 Tax=Acidithrix ferrooxidans TaxID=1280514 RepID=A0A0D8HHT5_9ACTN|nr:hypothetical protein AXFE_17310 [Acidithrix ferrooxidans]
MNIPQTSTNTALPLGISSLWITIVMSPSRGYLGRLGLS